MLRVEDMKTKNEYEMKWRKKASEKYPDALK